MADTDIQQLVERGLSLGDTSAYEQFGLEFDKLETTPLDGIKNHELRMYAVEQSTKIKDFTETLKKINDSLPAIIKICGKPKSHLKSINEIRPIDTVKRTGYESIPYLASHSEDWLARTASGLKPARLFSRVEEEDFQIYENRVVKTLIDKTCNFLKHYIDNLEFNHGQLKNIFDDKTLTHSFGFEKSFGIARAKLLPKGFYEDEKKINDIVKKFELAEKLLKESKKLKSKFQDLKKSRLYKILHRTKTVTNPLNETNILLLDRDYKKVFLLWKEIQKVIALEKNEEIKQEKVNVEKQYKDFCYSLVQFSIDSLYFESKENDISERKNDNLRISVSKTDNGFTLKLKDIKKRSLPMQGLEILFGEEETFGKFKRSDDMLYWENDADKNDIESFCKKIKPESNRQDKDQTLQRQWTNLKQKIIEVNSKAEKVKEKHLCIIPICCEIKDGEVNNFEKHLKDNFSQKDADKLIVALPIIDQNEQKLTNYAINKKRKTAILPLTLFDINSYRRIQKIILSLITELTEDKCPCCGNNTQKTDKGRQCNDCGIIITDTVCPKCKNKYKYLHYSTTEDKLKEMEKAEGFFNKDSLFQYKDIVGMEIREDLSLAPKCPKCTE